MQVLLQTRRQVFAAALGAALCPPHSLGQGLPADFADETWNDARRRRDLLLRLRWPATPGPWPVVLFSHGLGGSRAGGDAWGQAWRAAGLVVVHLQHPGSDGEVWRHGGLRALRAAADAQQLVARVGDVKFVLDEIERRVQAGSPPWRELRPDAVGLAGHSFGAHTAQAVAGQRFPVPFDGADARVRAFVALSPSVGRGGLSAQEQFGAVTRPFLGITGSDDGDPLGIPATGEPRTGIYAGLPPGARALLWLDGADHMTFAGNAQRRLDNPWLRRAPGAVEHEAGHHALVARITTLWWRAHLAGDASASAALAQPEGLAAGDRWSFG